MWRPSRTQVIRGNFVPRLLRRKDLATHSEIERRIAFE
jgi:hypothetical protein